MAARYDEILSFDQDLRHAFTPLSQRLERGVEGIDKLIEILRQRIQLEAEFARGIDKILQGCDFASEESGSIRDALDAIKADMRNEVRMRMDFVNSLNEDVYAPLIQTKDLYNARNIKYAQDTKGNIKSLRNEQSKWLKVKAKYDKATKDAQEARSALLNAKSNSSASSNQVIKLGSRVNTTMKLQQQLQERFDSTKHEWNREQIKFDDTMTTVLQGMESNEEQRLNALSDALTKWAVFVTNLTANRNYDVKSLAETMSQINVKEDLQEFMRTTLSKHPIKSVENMTPRSVYKFQDTHSNSLRTSSLSFSQAKRRKSLSKNDLKKIAQFGHGKKKSIDLSTKLKKHSNNDGNKSTSSVNGSNSNNNGTNGRHSRKNSDAEDSLSRKSFSDILRNNRMFRSSSSPDHGSKTHSREPSYGYQSGNAMDIMPEEETILPMPAEMLANKEKLVEPPPQPRNSFSKSSSSCGDPEIDAALDLELNEKNDSNNTNDTNNTNKEAEINRTKSEANDSHIEVPSQPSVLKVRSVEREIKQRNHKIIDSYTNKNIRYSIKKSSNNANNANSNANTDTNANANANTNPNPNRPEEARPRRRSSVHNPPTMKAPTPPVEHSIPVPVDGANKGTTIALNDNNSNDATNNNSQKPNSSNGPSTDSTPTLSATSITEMDTRVANELLNLQIGPNNPNILNRNDTSPPSSARNSLAHINTLKVGSPKTLKQPSIPEESPK